jgi:predicted methyltransferase
MKFALTLFLALFMATDVNADNQQEGMADRITKQMAAADRHSFDLPRDKARKPFETFRFLGLENGMTVMDVGAYAGYTTEMLAAAVGPEGKVYSQNTEQVYLNYAEGYYKRTMDERLAGNRLPNVVLLITEYDDLGLEGELDMAFLGNLIHDFLNRDGEELAVKFLRSIHRALKPGGVLGVVDHVGVAEKNNVPLHRIQPQDARDLLHQAGFVIEAESDLFANPEDDHSLMVYNEEIYRNTDRFFFKAVKPVE